MDDVGLMVSIIVPCYNAEKYISECIESLLSLDYPENKLEIIIVDNNSQDNTQEIIKKYPVVCLCEDKIQSSYAARNRGIKYAKGDILAFTDSDCIVTKRWLLKAIPGFADKKIGCIAGEIEGYEPETIVEEYLTDRGCLSQETTLRGQFLPYPQTANAIYRREVFEKIRLFEEHWISSGDADIAWRMQLETDYKIKYCPEALVFHRHRSNVKSLFKQRVKWGYGKVILCNKYSDRMDMEMLRKYNCSCLSIIKKLGKLLLFWVGAGHKNKGRRFYYRYLDVVSIIGKKYGLLKGARNERKQSRLATER